MARRGSGADSRDKAIPLRTHRLANALTILALLGAAHLGHAQRWHASTMRRPALLQPPPLSDMAHTSWTRRDGAPSDISALAQTSDGYLWIGSRLGLFRFDGLQFLHYPFNSADPQLPSSDISAIAPGKDGGLWIGYRLGGITHLRGRQKIDFGRDSGLIDESTEQLICREDGSVWATADGRLMHLNGSKWENFAARHGLQSEGLYSLFFDREGNLWTAEKGHVFRLRNGEENFELVAGRNDEANQVVQTPDGSIWISDAFHSVRPLEPEHRVQAVALPGVPQLLVDNDGSIWVAHDSNGISRIRPAAGSTSEVEHFSTANGLTDSQTRALLKDRQGMIWVGTARGLDRFQPSLPKPFTRVSLDYYPALLADAGGGIWLNDMDKPLMLYRSGNLSFVGAPHGSSSLFLDGRGGVWLFDQINRDFFRYREREAAPLRIPAPAEARQVENWCLGQDLDGALLACFEGHGLWKYDAAWSKVVAPGLPPEAPFSMAQGSAGHLWLGYSYNHIVLRDRDGFHRFGPQQGLDLNTALSFLEDPDLMLAGGSDGLAFRSGESFHAMHLRTPGLLRGISGIVRDRWGDLWLNAAPGVIRIPAPEWHAALGNPNYAMDFQLLQERDGLIGTPAQSKPSPSAAVDRDGILWFATSGHLVSVDPATLRQQRAAPFVLLQSVLANGSPVDTSRSTTITSPNGSLKTLEVNYIGLDLDSPERVNYQYLLEGQDHDWQDAGTRRQIVYTNLAHGHYRLRVRAASGAGTWSELPTPIAWNITPAFYQTAWFNLTIGLMVAGLLWWVYRLRIRFLTAKVRERFEERALERVRIARDLHDTLLQGIQGLVLRFHFATEQLPDGEPARETLRLALDQADHVIREGREKIGSLRAVSSPGGYLEKSFAQVAGTLSPESGIRIAISVKGVPRLLDPSVEDELYFIGREALTNAVRHANATHITLELNFDNRSLGLLCQDNGKGMSSLLRDQKKSEGHWGLTGMSERAQRLGSALHVSSAAGSGTRIEVRIAAKRAYAPRSRSPAPAHASLVEFGDRPSAEADPESAVLF